MGSTPRALSQAGIALLAVYIVILLGSLWPIQLVQSDFQLRVGTQLINSAPIALIGLAIIHLAATLDAGDPVLRRRRQRLAALAVAAALGFLLLIPLLTMASLRQLETQASRRSFELRRAESQLNSFRQAVSASTSPAELEGRFKALQGPRLDAADRIQPMPLLRTRVSALLDQLGEQLERRRRQEPPADLRQKLPEILRTALGALALAGGFAALARRPGAAFSLLDEFWLTWEDFRDDLKDRMPGRCFTGVAGRSRSTPPEEDYILQLSGKQDDTPEP